MIIFILLIISVIIYVVYVSNKKTSSSENVVHTQESMQHKTVVSGCPTEVIDVANEAIEILEQGAITQGDGSIVFTQHKGTVLLCSPDLFRVSSSGFASVFFTFKNN